MKWRLLMVLVLGLGLFSCADKIVSNCEEEIPAPPSIKFADIQATVFNPFCAGCHAGGANAPGGLDLTEGNAYNNLVSIPSSEVSSLFRVAPGNSADSYLIIKLEGSDSRMQGDRMPQGGPYLSQAMVDSIKSWIDAGALP